MVRFMLLATGFEMPTQEIMDAWMKWFESIKDHIADGGSPFGPGRELTRTGTKDLPRDKGAITGYLIINVKDIEEAERLVKECPIITSVRIYEAMSR